MNSIGTLEWWSWLNFATFYTPMRVRVFTCSIHCSIENVYTWNLRVVLYWWTMMRKVQFHNCWACLTGWLSIQNKRLRSRAHVLLIFINNWFEAALLTTQVFACTNSYADHSRLLLQGHSFRINSAEVFTSSLILRHSTCPKNWKLDLFQLYANIQSFSSSLYFGLSYKN